MELLIDTWNVLHQTGVLPADSAGIGTAGLCKMIENSRWGREKVSLICDGTPSDEHELGVRYRLVFTGPIKTADTEIMERVANSSSPKSILVVTSDREIIKSIANAVHNKLGLLHFYTFLLKTVIFPKQKQFEDHPVFRQNLHKSGKNILELTRRFLKSYIMNRCRNLFVMYLVKT